MSVVKARTITGLAMQVRTTRRCNGERLSWSMVVLIGTSIAVSVSALRCKTTNESLEYDDLKRLGPPFELSVCHCDVGMRYNCTTRSCTSRCADPERPHPVYYPNSDVSCDPDAANFICKQYDSDSNCTKCDCGTCLEDAVAFLGYCVDNSVRVVNAASNPPVYYNLSALGDRTTCNSPPKSDPGKEVTRTNVEVGAAVGGIALLTIISAVARCARKRIKRHPSPNKQEERPLILSQDSVDTPRIQSPNSAGVRRNIVENSTSQSAFVSVMEHTCPTSDDDLAEQGLAEPEDSAGIMEQGPMPVIHIPDDLNDCMAGSKVVVGMIPPMEQPGHHSSTEYYAVYFKVPGTCAVLTNENLAQATATMHPALYHPYDDYVPPTIRPPSPIAQVDEDGDTVTLFRTSQSRFCVCSKDTDDATLKKMLASAQDRSKVGHHSASKAFASRFNSQVPTIYSNKLDKTLPMLASLVS